MFQALGNKAFKRLIPFSRYCWMYSCLSCASYETRMQHQEVKRQGVIEILSQSCLKVHSLGILWVLLRIKSAMKGTFWQCKLKSNFMTR